MSLKVGYEDGTTALLLRHTRPARLTQSRIRAYLVLLTIAAIFSSILPTPWSLFGGNSIRQVAFKSTNPASEWQDNIWPIREQTPWDISTDYHYPRMLEYDVT